MVNDKALFVRGQFALERLGTDVVHELEDLAGRIERMRSGRRAAPMEQRRRRGAEHRLRRALEGYLDGVITAKELEAIRAQCSQETEAADAEAKAEPLRLPEVSAGL